MIRTWLQHRLLRFVPLVAILVVGTALSAASLIWARQLERRRVQLEFDSRAGDIEALLSRRVGASLEVLNSIERLYASSQEVDAAEFEQFTRHALESYPGLRMLAWAPRTAGLNGDRFPIEFVAPPDQGAALRGMELTTSPALVATMEMSRDQDALRATAPIALRTDRGETTFDSVVFIPIFRKAAGEPSILDASHRREALRGFAVAGLKLDRMMAAALASLDLHGQEIELFDAPPAAGVAPLYSSRVQDAAGASRTSIQAWKRPLALGGRSWWLVGTPTPTYVGSGRSVPVWAIPAVGMTFTALLGAYLHTLGNRTRRVQALVASRTIELETANRELAREIDDRRRTETALSESEERNRVVVQQAADGITLVDAETLRIVEANHAFARLLGYPREELVGRPIADFIVDTKDGVAARAQQTLGSAAPSMTRRQYRRKDGSIVDAEKSAAVIQLGGRRVLCTVVHDITARKRAEEKLAEERNLLRTLIDNLPDRINVKDAQGRYVLDNTAHLSQMGLSSSDQLLGKTVHDFYPPEMAQRLERQDRAVINSGRAMIDHEESIMDHDGEQRWVLVTRVPILDAQRQVQGMVGMTRDITARKRAEQALEEKHRLLGEAMQAEHEALEKLKETQGALVQSEKLAGLGQMVAGVAHEINNPLAFVSNNVAVLQRDVRALCELLNLYARGDDLLAQHRADLLAEIKDLAERMDLDYTRQNLQDMLTRSREGLGRIQQIVKDLREFARLDKGDLQEVSLNAGIESTVNIVRGLAKKKQVTLDLQLGELPPVACYPAKINQVVMNLITNAIDASAEKGKVIIRTGRDAGTGAIRIEVIDAGHGIDPGVARKIFDPFFTTKAIGKGTGLGLSISYGIVKEHGGTIAVESGLGQGARFIVTLPCGGQADGNETATHSAATS